MSNADISEETQTVLSNVFGSYVTASNEENSDHIQDRSRIAYDRVLAKYCVRPLPVFPYVKKRKHLTIVNEWIPAKWMEDREVKDGLYGNDVGNNNDDDETNVSGISSDLFWVDINPLSKERHGLVTDALREAGIRLIDDVFERHYLNAQFKSHGDIHGVIEKPLVSMWERFISNFFKLGDEAYHKVGTRMEAHLSVATQ
jgi:hypothetical protein